MQTIIHQDGQNDHAHWLAERMMARRAILEDSSRHTNSKSDINSSNSSNRYEAAARDTTFKQKEFSYGLLTLTFYVSD